jgi:hypothetical protein
MDPDAAATGAVMGPATLRRYAEAAGLHEFEIAPIEHPQWRFYLIRKEEWGQGAKGGKGKLSMANGQLSIVDEAGGQ